MVRRLEAKYRTSPMARSPARSALARGGGADYATVGEAASSELLPPGYEPRLMQMVQRPNGVTAMSNVEARDLYF